MVTLAANSALADMIGTVFAQKISGRFVLRGHLRGSLVVIAEVSLSGSGRECMEKQQGVDTMAASRRHLFPWVSMTIVVVALSAGSAWGRLGLLGRCDFGVHQVQKSVEDIQFYSDWPDPYSWITFQDEPISSHAATRHFWLFLQVSDDELSGALLQAADLRWEVETILSRTESHEERSRRLLLIEEALQRYGEDVSAKGAYFEIIVSYDPQAPDPNPLADFQLAYPGSQYFYVLAVYNLEMTGAVDIIWSDVTVAVVLSSFSARSGAGEVILEWATESEQQNLGFHIFRQEGSQGTFQPLTEELIPSACGGQSQTQQTYRCVDRQVEPGLEYHYQLQDVGFDGRRTVLGTVTVASLSSDARPSQFQLLQNYPNPFNASTQISYNLPVDAEVLIRIFDVSGRLVRTLVEGHRQAGQHMVRWDGCNLTGGMAASGLYFCSLETQGQSQRMKMVLLR